MFVLKKKGSVEYFAVTVWNAYPAITHAFCTRRGGISADPYASLNMSRKEGEAEANVSANWDIAAAAFGLAGGQFFRISQVHGEGILVIDGEGFRSPTDRPPEYDAVITNRPGLALCILTADCVPVLMFDRAKRVVAAVHAGWRGTALNISGRVATMFRERFRSRPEDLLAAVGPAIGPCCYEVDEAVYGAMAGHPHRDELFCPQVPAGRWKLDLPLANRRQLEEAGIPGENICTANLCTSCHRGLFFSHRGEGGTTGRLLNFIMWNG